MTEKKKETETHRDKGVIEIQRETEREKTQ